MSSGIYSDLKMAWHLIRDGKVANVPKQMQLILSALCNQDCHFCAYRMDGYSSNEMFVGNSERARFGHNNPKRWMPTEKAIEILDDAAKVGVLGIQFTGGGEPTVQPDHERIFQHALGNGLKCALVSNGLHWSDSLLALLPRFSWVRVSVDAGNENTYAKTRNTPPGNYGKVLGNIKRLAHGIRTPKHTGCVLGVGWVVTPENWTEIEEGVKAAAATGAAYIRLSAMFSQHGIEPYREIHGRIREAIMRARDSWERPDFKVHDLFGERVADLEDGPPDYPECYYQHYNTFVGDDQNVYRCCVTSYSKHGLLGSLDRRTYAEFLADEEVQRRLHNFDARSCSRCQFNNKNRAMNYILGGKPPHAEFP